MLMFDFRSQLKVMRNYDDKCLLSIIFIIIMRKRMLLRLLVIQILYSNYLMTVIYCYSN